MRLLEFDPRNGDDLVDICAGSGGFLLAGIKHIRSLIDSESPEESPEAQVVELAAAALRGQEIDPEICGIANAALSARVGKPGLTFISQGNSLQPGVFGLGHPLGLNYGKHLCAASNPPFGTKTTVKDPAILRQFDLARLNGRPAIADGVTSLHRRPLDILLLEQNLRILKPGQGRLAIVLPYQILSGPQALYVRQWLLRHAQLLAVIDLPNETFQPYTGTKTSLVVIKRRERPLEATLQHDEHLIFMSIPRWIGHDRRGNPVYERAPDGTSTDRVLSDFDSVGRAFEEFTSGGNLEGIHQRSFALPERYIIQDPLLRFNALFHRSSQTGLSLGSSGIKTARWGSVKMREVVQRIFYPGRFKRNYVDYSPGAVPFFGGADIKEMIVRTDKWLSPDDPKLEELRVKAGWLLITRSGSTGIVSMVPKAWEGFAFSEHVIRIVPDPSKLAPEYIQAFLRTRFAQEKLSRGVFGSVIDEISPNFVGDLDVLVPTSTEFLLYIVAQVQKAEDARQQALQRLFRAVDQLSDMLEGHAGDSWQDHQEEEDRRAP